jgi:Flp pilus assembly protein TadG
VLLRSWHRNFGITSRAAGLRILVTVSPWPLAAPPIPRCGSGGPSIINALRRRRRRADAGVSMVEFAIVAPIGFLLLLGVGILGVVEMDTVQLSNLTRDSARAGAICGSASRAGGTQLPDGAACTYANLQTYISNRVRGLPSGTASKPSTSGFGSNCDTTGANAIVCVWTPSHGAVSISGSNPLDACAKGDVLEVVTQFNAELYLPLVSRVMASSGTTRSLVADASGACEQ